MVTTVFVWQKAHYADLPNGKWCRKRVAVAGKYLSISTLQSKNARVTDNTCKILTPQYEIEIYQSDICVIANEQNISECWAGLCYIQYICLEKDRKIDVRTEF